MKGIYFTRCDCRLFAMMMLVAGLLAATPQVSSAQFFRRCDPCVPCPTGEAQSGTGAQAGSGGTPEPSPAANLFAQQDVGAAGGGASKTVRFRQELRMLALELRGNPG